MQAKFVDIWHGRLSHVLSNLKPILSKEERQRAETFKLPVAQQRYISVRTALRKTLAAYLDMDPAQVTFQTGLHGKPHLAGHPLHFNLSHTLDDLIIAAGNVANIGVDIELIRPRNGIDNLAARCFCDAELKAWQSLPSEQKLEAFYRIWTKKESFVKAVGRGIALGLERCEVDIKSGGQMQRIPSEFGRASDWLLTELPVDTHRVATLATPACHFTLRQISLDTDSKTSHTLHV